MPKINLATQTNRRNFERERANCNKILILRIIIRFRKYAIIFWLDYKEMINLLTAKAIYLFVYPLAFINQKVAIINLRSDLLLKLS